MAWHAPPTALGWLVAGNKAQGGFTKANKIQVTLCLVYMVFDCIDFEIYTVIQNNDNNVVF